MSYSVRDDAATFGPNASVEILNGAGAPTLAKLQVFEAICFNAPTATQFAESTYYTLYLAPPAPSASLGLGAVPYTGQVAGLSVYYSAAAGAAAQFYCEICPAGTANGSGNNVIGASSGSGYYLLNTALATANTPVNLPLSTNVDNLQITANGRINIYATTQVTTTLADFCVTIYLIRI